VSYNIECSPLLPNLDSQLKLAAYSSLTFELFEPPPHHVHRHGIFCFQLIPICNANKHSMISLYKFNVCWIYFVVYTQTLYASAVSVFCLGSKLLKAASAHFLTQNNKEGKKNVVAKLGYYHL
jgi:hypothetical protein